MADIRKKKFKNYRIIQTSGLVNMATQKDAVVGLSKFCAVVNEDDHFSPNLLVLEDVEKCQLHYGEFDSRYDFDDHEINEKGRLLKDLKEDMEAVKSYGNILSVALDDEKPVINVIVLDEEEAKDSDLGVLEQYGRILEVKEK